ncbi:MAG: RpiB/LacA/LacB family sugar-phosphate isomerase [Candidatus Methanomethylicia archaeon]
MKIVIACDHAGFKLKGKTFNLLGSELEFVDVGTNSEDPVNYLDITERACGFIVKCPIRHIYEAIYYPS